MKRLLHPWRLAASTVFLLTAALYLYADNRIPDSLKRPNMTALSPRLQPLFETTRTVCFGRFVLEVPATATVVYGPAHVDYPITYYPGEADKLAQHVTEQLGEVEKDRDLLDERELDKFTLFGKVIDGAVPGQKLVFGSAQQVAYTVHSYIPVGKDLFVQRGSASLDKKDGGIASTDKKDDEGIVSLNTVARLLRLRAENEVPAEPGICIDGGFVPWQPESENITLGVRLKEFPDVHFSIQTRKNKDHLTESSALEPLLKRAEKDAMRTPQGSSWYSRIKFFRRGARQLGDWNGFEVLAHKPAQENTTDSHEFHFVSLGAPNDPLQPLLDIKLDTGVKNDRTASKRPSLTDEEAVALWDKLTGSIRVRKASDASAQPVSAAEPARVPLGELAATGRPCPHTGWWQCSESGAVAGGTRQHFMAGETLPPAVLLGDPGVWQKLKNERPRHETATVWRLVDYDTAPDITPAEPAPAPGKG